MTAEKYLTYRGDIKAAVGAGGTLVFVTVHPEGQSTGLYRLEADKLTLDVDPLRKRSSSYLGETGGVAKKSGLPVFLAIRT